MSWSPDDCLLRQSRPTADVAGTSESDPGCVKTLHGITAPRILGSVVVRRAKKCKKLSSARHYDQTRFRFHTTKTLTGPKPGRNPAAQRAPDLILADPLCCHGTSASACNS